MSEQKTLMEFPCEFSLKVFGKAEDDFEVAVLSIVNKHVNKLKEDAIKTKNSGKDKYMAMTITFTAESKQQLDAVYTDLSAHELVIMAL